MAEYKRIAIIGATGSLGAPVLKGLVEAGFDVTVLVRTAGKLPADQASKVTEVVVDFTSLDSLTSALHGQDAVVSTIGHTGLGGQEVLIKAAVAAGVKRFLPSEFGCDLSPPQVRNLPTYGPKIKIQELLKQEAAAAAAGGEDDGLSYTFVANNLFLDWGLRAGGALGDVRGRKATTFDGGEHRISVSRLETVARAVVAVLQHPAETRNKQIRVHDGALSQHEIIAALKEVATTAGGEWTIVDQSAAEVKAKSDAALAGGVLEPWVFRGYIWVAAFGKDGESDFTGRTWNDVLGLKEHTAEELKAIIRDIAKEIVAA